MSNLYEQQDYNILDNLITNEARVLFIYPSDLEFVRRLCQDKKLTCDVMYYKTEDIVKASDQGFSVINASINRDFVTMESKKYDFVIADCILQNARFLGDTIKNIARIGTFGIIGNMNVAHYAMRFKFLFYGSLFVKNAFKQDANNSQPWYDKDPWQLSSKDIINLCLSNDIAIKSGFYYDRGGKIGNIFSIKGFPNLYAVKGYYLISEENYLSTIKNYTMNANLI